MSFSLAIIGRPNVGKSTLFNRLTGKKLALVDDRPGVTRDRREGEAKLADLRFTIIDTAGLEEGPRATLEGRMRAQTESAILAADGRAQHDKVTHQVTLICDNCGADKLSHRACPACGWHKGRVAVEVKKKDTEAEAPAAE